jgi:hypothetical protein
MCIEFQAMEIYHQISALFTDCFSVAWGTKPPKVFFEFYFNLPIEIPLNPLLLIKQTLTLSNSLNVRMFYTALFIAIFCLL